MNRSFNKIKPLVLPLGKKKVLWVPSLNKYLVAEPLAAEIILQLTDGRPIQKIARQIEREMSVPVNESLELIKQINHIWEKNTIQTQSEDYDNFNDKKHPGSIVYSSKTYRINKLNFYVEYETADAEWFNHPKFAHLEVSTGHKSHHYFRVEDSDSFLTLWVNGKNTGSWKKSENHFLSGKFSMQMIQKIYEKDEDQWMGVFHAAGISNGKQCMLFFGDSGNGKSTLSALLMANGFDVLSDDFLPVESSTGLVYRFPAALSIKKQAYDLIMSFYPELIDAGEYENPAFKKTYRFLPPKSLALTGVPCKAIVHIKYDPNVEFQIEKLAPEDAFTLLVPDSWINRTKENVSRFIIWFEKQEHYQLIYSDNKNMISTIKKILNDEG